MCSGDQMSVIDKMYVVNAISQIADNIELFDFDDLSEVEFTFTTKNGEQYLLKVNMEDDNNDGE